MNGDCSVTFSAQLFLYTKENGGRHTPIESGFRTDVKFKDEVRFSVFKFEKSSLPPGGRINAEVKLLLHSDEEVSYFLSEDCLLILEGDARIGELSNLKLKKKENL